MNFFWILQDTLCYIYPRNGKPVSVTVFIIFGGKSSVALYNTIIRLSYINYRNYEKTIKLNE